MCQKMTLAVFASTSSTEGEQRAALECYVGKSNNPATRFKT